MFPDIRHPKTYVSLILLIAMFLLPVIMGTPFWTNLFVLLFVFSALSVAWNIVGGYAGQLSLGHAVFYGIGGYTATLLTQNFGISPWFGMLAGAAISGAVAILISYPTLRLRGPFFALATIAILEVVRLLVIHEESWTGGSSGISLPLNIGWTWIVFREKVNYVIIAFALFLLVTWVSWYIRKSRIGHYLIAIREREDAALAVGIHTVRMKIIAAVVSAMLTSIIGTFHITYLTFVDPSSAFSLELSIQVAMFALIGGLGTVAGPIAGTFLVLPIAELARGWLSSVGNGMHGLIYGLILVAVVLTIPRGLAGAFGPAIERWLSRLPYLGTPRAKLKLADELRLHSAERSEQPVLKADKLFKSFGGLRATNDVSLTLNQNEILGMIGPNGAGKTTVFNLLSGFLSPDKGGISMLDAHGKWVTCKTPDEFAHQGLGRTFQIAKPFTGLTVLENIMLGAFIRTSNRDEAEQIALKVAEQTDLVKYLGIEARNLTVGGMKRLEVARALAIKPRILLLDEVMAGLNPTDIEKSIQMIRRIRDSGVSVLLIEHMMQATMALSDRIIVLNEGAVLVSGAPKDVVENPAVIEAYLGKEYQDA
ncbi:branched-chain amino acid ABC transporter ATP-binding protein/permease [Achromobacter insolitus]|uniref:Vitamin B12 import ATP-binding protein BtuD n=1 Tax=Achromobacter insolitus TaxID=217204 RepID=A0A6S7FDL9_9BURK|nr:MULTISPECIES: branched-chain amino acid ABC transporter ATP-binding protein/permease [Achromobacter]GLK96120.1 metal-dependent hydrolase [Achromobacter xylosoxidans]APX75752.1 branched-chain amino acid ABC transporter ATP-binding protein [Achromobacter insolitus]AVG40664.1 branched-chain amino acid ABC transporter ATP-binding protein [Achromobacter insolitus]AXA71342.1 branched-chain amino acid ABC transporter ATP-binding protein [Achromobacter insolitus]MCP1401949.1 branched-chain amino ac